METYKEHIDEALSEIRQVSFELNDLVKLSNAIIDKNNQSLVHMLEEMSRKLNNSLSKYDIYYKGQYEYRGKSRSIEKIRAARENGKMGGRPSKKIIELRKRKDELEDELIEYKYKGLNTRKLTVERNKIIDLLDRYSEKKTGEKDVL